LDRVEANGGLIRI
jgi:acetyl-CoA synthetase